MRTEEMITLVIVFMIGIYFISGLAVFRITTVDETAIRAQLEKQFEHRYDALIKENDSLKAQRFPWEIFALVNFVGLALIGLFYWTIQDKKLNIEKMKLEKRK